MTTKSTDRPVLVIPNLNGGDDLLAAVASLQKQSVRPHVIVVDNASTDGSAEKAQQKFPDIELIKHTENKGYAGGVNAGLRQAMQIGATYAGVFNDDATAQPGWLEKLVQTLDKNPKLGAATGKVLHADGKILDSTSDYLTSWGLPYPRGRGEEDKGQYDHQTDIVSPSGAATLYRVDALKETGLFDEDFFAYYEDVDLGLRLQLSGWKAAYVPEARVYHAIGMTSSKMKGFTTYQTMKNLPLLTYKNIPEPYLKHVQRRLNVALTLFLLRSITRGHLKYALKGLKDARRLKDPKQRQKIQDNKKISDQEFWALIVKDLPPNASALRKLRSLKWRILR